MLILLAFIAVVTFIRAYDNAAGITANLHSGTPGISSNLEDLISGH